MDLIAQYAGKADEYLAKLHIALNSINTRKVGEIVDVLYTAYQLDKEVFIIGNGGSAATATHFACDLSKGTLGSRCTNTKMRRFRVSTPADNLATLTAYGNDTSYDEVFAQAIAGRISQDDILIAISASGNSPNILKALEVAKDARAKRIGFLGFDGGHAKDMTDYNIVIPSPERNYGVVEDAHLALEHMICDVLRTKILGNM